MTPDTTDTPAAALAAAPATPLIPITLTAYQWAGVLDVIDHQLAIVNRDPMPAVEAYEQIASQLAGRPVKVTLNGRDPRAPTPKPAPQAQVADMSRPPTSLSFWQRVRWLCSNRLS